MNNQFVTKEQILAAETAVRQQTSQRPTIALVLGSGLSGLADAVTDADIIPHNSIPHWPASTAPGHKGRLVIGQLQGKTVLVLQGRGHSYEGYSLQHITLPVRVMHRLGIKTLILTNAAGAITASFTPGDLMLIKDHINLPGLAGNNPLRGPNDDSVGPRFPDMISAYSTDLRQLAKQVANEQNIQLHEGTYAFVGGPTYETPAELRLLGNAGADAVGMSTVPSVIVGHHAGLRVMGISTLTNMAVPDPKPGTVLTHEEVLEVGREVVPKLTNLLHGLLAQLD